MESTLLITKLWIKINAAPDLMLKVGGEIMHSQALTYEAYVDSLCILARCLFTEGQRVEGDPPQKIFFYCVRADIFTISSTA